MNKKKTRKELVTEINKLLNDLNTGSDTQDTSSIFKFFFEAVTQGVLVLTPEGKIKYANPSLYTLVGEKNPGSMTGKYCIPFYPGPVQTQLLSEILPDVIEKGTWYGELSLKTGDGIEIPVQCSFFQLQNNEDGIPLIGQIISESPCAEIRESEEQYRTLAETANNFIYTLGSDGTFKYVNSYAANCYGRTPGDIIGRKINSLIPGEKGKQISRYLEKILGKGVPKFVESKLPFPGGERWLSSNLVPIKSKNGNDMSLLGVSLDVTERKKAEEEIALLKTALEATANSVFITDRHGDIAWANIAFTELTGYSVQEIIGENARILSSGKHGQSVYEELWQTILSGKVYRGELTNKHKNGLLYIERITITPVINKAGELSHFIAVLQDVTEQKANEVLLHKQREKLEEAVSRRTRELQKANEQLKTEVEEHKHTQAFLAGAKEQAEAAVKAKSAFLAGMSHELRTPLNAIIGFSEVLQEQFFGELNVKQKHYVHHILDSGKNLLSLINNILDLSKVEAGNMNLEISQVDVHDILERSYTIFMQKAPKKGLHMKLELSSETEGLFISADRSRLLQAVYNLLSNAVKFTSPGGIITTSCRRSYGSVVISVMDTGIGIDPEQAEAIFDDFHQDNGMFKHPGSGLGLPLAKRIVEMHGGKIQAESKGTDMGSIFTISLPVNMPAANLAVNR